MQLADQYVWGLAYQNELVERDAATIGTVTSGTLTLAAIGTLGGITTFSTQRLYALQDANYNVVALANTSGTIVERFDYTPYGTQTVLTAGGEVNNNGDSYSFAIGFQGMVRDPVTQNWDSETRVLRSSLDIWMTQEPFGAWYIDGVNLYQAFDSNPATMVDPSGLLPVWAPGMGSKGSDHGANETWGASLPVLGGLALFPAVVLWPETMLPLIGKMLIHKLLPGSNPQQCPTSDAPPAQNPPAPPDTPRPTPPLPPGWTIDPDGIISGTWTWQPPPPSGGSNRGLDPGDGGTSPFDNNHWYDDPNNPWIKNPENN